MKPGSKLPIYNLGIKKEDSRFFEITTLDNLRKRPGDWPSGLPHRHSFYEILYLINGEGRHFIDFNPYLLIKNSMQYSSSHESLLVHRFQKLVTKEFANEKALQAYADWLNVSIGHLSNTVKKITGHSPGGIIRKEIILNTKRLLSHTNMTVAEIAYKFNFDDPSYFGRFFKRETRMSPIQFRKKIREKCHINLD